MRPLRCPTIAFSLLLGSLWAVTAGADTPAALIGSQSISTADLDARIAGKVAELQKTFDRAAAQLKVRYARQRYALAEQELQSLLDERVLALEAAARKSTPDKLTASVKDAQVTDAQVQAFYDKNRSQMNQPADKMAPVIKDYLQKQAHEDAQRAYLDSLRKKYKASINLEPLRETVGTAGPQRGPDDATVTIVEFSDFQCPFCGRFSPVLESVRQKYPRQVRVIYRHLPLTSLHPNAQGAAEAAACAARQGKFWELHDLMFAQQSSLDHEGLVQKVRQLGLDEKQFSECIGSGEGRKVVQADSDEAETLAIGGTPASFINGRFLNGAVPAEDITAIIEDELRRAAPTARR